MIEVNIFNDTEVKRLPRKSIKELVTAVLKKYKVKNAEINVIYVDNETILDINKKFLKHNYVTDVITFDLGEKNNILAEIYISVEKAESQAKDYKVSLRNELNRLAVHGALHLVGFDDDTPEKRKKMEQLENKFLELHYV